jgi:Protein of unknown function (DUF3616)
MKTHAHVNALTFTSRLVAAVVATLICATPAASQERPQALKPAGSPWSVSPAFEKKEAREAISGAACAPTSPVVCLAANDEKKYAQFFTLERFKLVPGKLIRLVPDKEGDFEFDELDTEGVAYDGGFFYVIGSHGAPRRSNTIDPSRFFIHRFKVDEQTGMPAFPFSGDVAAKEIVRTDKLREVIKNAKEIAPFAEQPLNKNGANIEGIAVKAGRIFLGFRGPSIDENALIMEVDANAVFGKAPIEAKVHQVRLGKDVGIRDLAAVQSGLLILAGPTPDEKSLADGTRIDYPVLHWDGRSPDVKPLGRLDGVPKEGKPETLLVLEDSAPKPYRVLVLIESIENASPTEYVIER